MNSFLAIILVGASAFASAVDPSAYFGGTGKDTYLDWLDNSSYDHHAWLASSSNSSLGVSLHWTTDATHIQLAVAAKASGWVGFGLAESGSMRGADIIMYSAETKELVDSYVLDDLVTPMTDNCQSWTLVNSVTQGGFIIFEASRLLDTGDTQDRRIIDDGDELVAATRVIAAWGDSSAPAFHGLDNRARGSVRFMGATSVDELESFQSSVAFEAEGNFTLAANDYEIPGVETTYALFCFSGADLAAMGVPIDEDLHVIGIEPIIESLSSKYVHHFTVTGMNDPWDSSLDCTTEYPGFEMTYVWAPGDMPLDLPANVGGPLGVSGFRSFKLEIHYDNPGLDTGKRDSSGIRVHFTSKKRQYDLGVFQVGDPRLSLRNLTVSNNTSLAGHTFDCLNSCSAAFLNQSVTVISEHLHMHKAGMSIINSQIRDDQVVRVGEVQFWDFAQQGNLGVVQQPFTIQPGDSFRTTCNYNAKDGEVFGLGSSDEMCIAFLFYYPRQFVPSQFGNIPFMCGPKVFGDFLLECDASWTSADFQDVSQLGRTFGVAPPSCPPPAPADFPTSSPNALSAPTSAASGHVWYWSMAVSMVLAWVGARSVA